MNCIQLRNQGAGFQGSHRRFCTYCEADATCHANVGYWCGNVCLPCAKKKFKPGQVEEGVFLVGSVDQGSDLTSV